MLQSNELWYAFYGEKGMPIYENWESVFDYRLISPKMRHNGRFHKDSNSKVSAVIFSFPNSTIIYENPYCKKKSLNGLLKVHSLLDGLNMNIPKLIFLRRHY